MRQWVDEITGKLVRQLTDFPHGARVNYFRYPRYLPGGLVQAFANDEKGSRIIVMEPQSGEVRDTGISASGWLKLRESDGTVWLRDDRRISAVKLPDGIPKVIGELPESVPGSVADITCDGKTVLCLEMVQDLEKYPVPTTKDIDLFWHYFSRPRNGTIWSYDLHTQKQTEVVHTDGVCPNHVDTHPTDPTLLKFCHDMFDALGQRIWSVRIDGSELKKIRPQEIGEFVTHEFWWPDGKHIGYTYQDRRKDTKLHELPWGEYSPMPTHLGIADLTGREVYMSDALNCYHSHLYVSPDGRFICGEGTEGHSFAYAARFDWGNPKIEMIPMATIHTPYVPFRGQGVETCFSPDSRWLLYNDTINGKLQICETLLDFEC